MKTYILLLTLALAAVSCRCWDCDGIPEESPVARMVWKCQFSDSATGTESRDNQTIIWDSSYRIVHTENMAVDSYRSQQRVYRFRNDALGQTAKQDSALVLQNLYGLGLKYVSVSADSVSLFFVSDNKPYRKFYRLSGTYRRY